MSNQEVWYYKFMDDLPHPPQKFIDAALQLAHDPIRSKTEFVNDADYLPKFDRPLVYPDGVKGTSRRTPRWDFSQEFEAWVRENIHPNPIDAAVSISQGNSNITGPHTDGVRAWTYLYLIERSNEGQTTCWWRERGQPLYRGRSYWAPSFENLDKLAEIEFPIGKWVALNITILHSIHNIQGSRVSLQVSLPNDPVTGNTEDPIG